MRREPSTLARQAASKARAKPLRASHLFPGLVGGQGKSRQHAVAANWHAELARPFVDAETSGAVWERPGLQSLLRELERKRVQHVFRTRKLPIHAREGVEHLWLVDPALRTLEALRLDG